jgi:pimeloyl-ACP methyl ester carboxylesterase
MAEDVYQFIQALQLENVTYYGFSDGGIIGILLASKYPKLFKKMIISGANTYPGAIKKWLGLVFRVMQWFQKSPLNELMLTEPHIDPVSLRRIDIPVLVTAGEHDLILKEETDRIAENLPKSRLVIVEGADHGSYIVNSEVMGELLIRFLDEEWDMCDQRTL